MGDRFYDFLHSDGAAGLRGDPPAGPETFFSPEGEYDALDLWEEEEDY